MEIERINKDMRLILYSPGIWVLHRDACDYLRYIVIHLCRTQMMKNNEHRACTMTITCMNAHVAVPSGSVVECLSTDRTLLPFLWIAHPCSLQLLHVVVQLHLRLAGKVNWG